jgi:hypothetical protein
MRFTIMENCILYQRGARIVAYPNTDENVQFVWDMKDLFKLYVQSFDDRIIFTEVIMELHYV